VCFVCVLLCVKKTDDARRPPAGVVPTTHSFHRIIIS
jgi:hypothetical protein